MNTRRPTSSVALIPKVEGRVSSAEKKRPFPRRSSPDARYPGVPRTGMTLIELGIVMGIVSILLGLVLGLGRHVNAVVKIRRAQAELGEWHETLNRWFLQFGEYPYAVIDTADETKGSPDSLLETANPSLNLSNLLDHCEVRFATSTYTTNITFRSFLTTGVSAIDPWGSPYIYDCDPGRKAYTLFSCGPDARTILPDGTKIPSGTPSSPDPTLDDIHFER